MLQRHPWIFSGAVHHITGKVNAGDVVRVVSGEGKFLAWGHYSVNTRIAVRVLEWHEENEIDEAWYEQRLQAAFDARGSILNSETNTCRLVFAEGDYLPGLIVDKYADYLAVQISSTGMYRCLPLIAAILGRLTGCKGILNKSDEAALAHEQMEPFDFLVHGELPPEFVEVTENGVRYKINIEAGQKSGFYCDQRENRKIVAQYATGKTVLDCFCYTGGFTLNALKNGAKRVVSVDSSATALTALQMNVEVNGMAGEAVAFVEKDVSKQIKTLIFEEAKFDLVILDPPKYAPTRSSLEKAARAYKDLNRRAMALLPAGGLLATFSCSGAMDMFTFKQVIAWAAMDAGREVQVVEQLTQPADHPVRLSFIEGEYLKGLLVRVL